MINVFRRLAGCGAAVLFSIALAGTGAHAQTAAQDQTAFDRQLARVDVSLSGFGEFTTNTSGSTSATQTVSLRPSTTLGFLITARYIKSPLVGVEFNFARARYSENFLFTNIAPGSSGQTALDVQTNATEYTFGYVVHTPRYFGVQPFASVGAGSTAFRPSKNGGQGFTPQARASYYYSVGVEELVYGKHLGLRASFRQVFALAPDFQATYLRDHQRTVESEPTVGFFVRF